MDEVIKKFYKYADSLLQKSDGDTFLKLSIGQAKEKLWQINKVYLRTLQLEFCIGHNSLLMLTKRQYPDWEVPKVVAPDNIFPSQEHYEFMVRGKNIADLQFDLRTDVESLYYLAFRFTKIVDEIPGLKKFNPVGIRDVRNHLLVHPRHKFLNTFSMTYEEGTALTTHFYKLDDNGKYVVEKTELDRGHTKNFEEFESDLDHLLSLKLEDNTVPNRVQPPAGQ